MPDFGDLQHTPPNYLSVKDAVTAGMRLPLALYVFTMKMEADGYATRAYRGVRSWHIEVLFVEAQIHSTPDLRTNGFDLSTYDQATDRYIFSRDIT